MGRGAAVAAAASACCLSALWPLAGVGAVLLDVEVDVDEHTESSIDETLRGPSWSVKEYLLAHDPVARATELAKITAHQKEDADRKEKFREALELPSASEIMSSFKNVGETVRKNGVLQMQKMKADAAQRKFEHAEIAKQERFTKEYLRAKEVKAGEQERRVEVDLNKQSQQIHVIEMAQKQGAERAAAQKVKDLAEKLKKKQHAEADIRHEKRSAAGHYLRSVPGKPCPEGWAAVDSEEACRKASLVLGGKDDVGLHRKWDNHPSGCFWEAINGHVAFNSAPEGAANAHDEQICASERRAGRRSLEKEEESVHDAEARMQKKMVHDVRVAQVQLNDRIHKRV